MKIGNLYQIKMYHWLLYPTEAGAADASEATFTSFGHSHTIKGCGAGRYWSDRLETNVLEVGPETVFVLLDKQGVYSKVLTTEGQLVWMVIYGKDINAFKKL
jgi:hypothetical protein